MGAQEIPDLFKVLNMIAHRERHEPVKNIMFNERNKSAISKHLCIFLSIISNNLKFPLAIIEDRLKSDNFRKRNYHEIFYYMTAYTARNLDASCGFYRLDASLSSSCIKPVDFIKLHQDYSWLHQVASGL